MSYLKHHFRRFIVLAAAISMLAATTAGCGGYQDQAHRDANQVVHNFIKHYGPCAQGCPAP